MQFKSQQPKEREGVISTLNIAIDGVNVAKDALSIPGVKVVFGVVAMILIMIKVSFVLRFRWLTID